MKFKVKLERCEEGGYAVSVPALPGCFSQGETVEECMSNIREAIELYLESMEDEDKPEKGILVKEISL
jgi:antitoxin HicB